MRIDSSWSPSRVRIVVSVLYTFLPLAEIFFALSRPEASRRTHENRCRVIRGEVSIGKLMFFKALRKLLHTRARVLLESSLYFFVKLILLGMLCVVFCILYFCVCMCMRIVEEENIFWVSFDGPVFFFYRGRERTGEWIILRYHQSWGIMEGR